jgi:hypothetical protein
MRFAEFGSNKPARLLRALRPPLPRGDYVPPERVALPVLIVDGDTHLNRSAVL